MVYLFFPPDSFLRWNQAIELEFVLQAGEVCWTHFRPAVWPEGDRQSPRNMAIILGPGMSNPFLSSGCLRQTTELWRITETRVFCEHKAYPSGNRHCKGMWKGLKCEKDSNVKRVQMWKGFETSRLSGNSVLGGDCLYGRYYAFCWIWVFTRLGQVKPLKFLLP